MSALIPEEERQNYDLFRDCLSTVLLEKISEPQTKPRRRAKAKSKRKSTVTISPPSYDKPIPTQGGRDGNEQGSETLGQHGESHINPREDETGDNTIHGDDNFADFSDYITTEIFICLPAELRTIDYNDYIASPTLQTQYALPLTGADITTHLPNLNPGISDSLTTYGITNEQTQGVHKFLAPVLTAFLTALSTAPPPPSTTRADACEICGRDWINLSYHHLIPRFVHAKAVKRGWHSERDLQNVAWLCGACHRFVHRFAAHEELARRFYTVDLLLADEEVRRWAEWVGWLRCKGR